MGTGHSQCYGPESGNQWDECLGTDLDGDYTFGIAASLRSPLIDLSGSQEPKLQFNYYIESHAPDALAGIRFVDEFGDTILDLGGEAIRAQSDDWISFEAVIPELVVTNFPRIIIEFMFLTNPAPATKQPVLVGISMML